MGAALYNGSIVTKERVAEVERLLECARVWAEARPDVLAVGLAGSWAHGDARMDSDVDIILLTTDKESYLSGEAWVGELGGLWVINTEQWGPMTERRFVLASGLEVEMGIVPPLWADVDPVDHGTRRVVEDGLCVVYDPGEILARLVEACG